jgi:hypothetical protein
VQRYGTPAPNTADAIAQRYGTAAVTSRYGTRPGIPNFPQAPTVVNPGVLAPAAPAGPVTIESEKLLRFTMILEIVKLNQEAPKAK